MKLPGPERSSLRATAQKLRSIALASAAGTLLGSEDVVLAQLGVSRATLKQAARLLEQEGLIKVRRGTNGGYYSARPTEETLTIVANAYLETIDVTSGDIVSMTTLLWMEVIRRASIAPPAALVDNLKALIDHIAGLTVDASFHEVDKIEQASRRAIFDMVDCRYIELIMRINQAFGTRNPFATAPFDGTPAHLHFVAAWRKAKTLELQAIADADTPLAEVAARNCRKLWNRRVTLDRDAMRA
jgi:DNA-binding FadR family transcriptional regulator